MPNVFTYGTLEIPEVMEAVTGRTFSSAQATAKDFARYMLKRRIYPGMVEAEGQTTQGLLYYNVDSQSLEVLDAFEDEIYRRQRVTVQIQPGDWIEAYSYIIPLEEKSVLTSQPWCRDFFMTHHLASYISHCQMFYCGVRSKLS